MRAETTMADAYDTDNQLKCLISFLANYGGDLVE